MRTSVLSLLVFLGVGLSSCVDYGIDSAPRQFSGVWLHEFEGSTFIEGATGIPVKRPSYRETDWLEFSEASPFPQELLEPLGYDDERHCQRVQPFRVRFIGVRSWEPLGAGHLGISQSQVTVREVLAIERLGPPSCHGR